MHRVASCGSAVKFRRQVQSKTGRVSPLPSSLLDWESPVAFVSFFVFVVAIAPVGCDENNCG